MSGFPSPRAGRPVPAPSSLLPPADDQLLVWWATVDDVTPAVLEGLRADLDEDTLARINAMVREEDPRRSIVAHGLLRRLVAATTGIAAHDVAILRICANCGAADHGKPTLITRTGARPPLQFNLAHSGGVVAVALAGPAIDVGIDVEAFKDDFDWLPARRHVFTEGEWRRTDAAEDPSSERFALWARKEAAAKTTGHGLAIDLVHVAIDEPVAALGELDPDASPDVRRGRLTAPEQVYELIVIDIELDGTTAGAVATIAGPATPQVDVVRANLSA